MQLTGCFISQKNNSLETFNFKNESIYHYDLLTKLVIPLNIKKTAEAAICFEINVFDCFITSIDYFDRPYKSTHSFNSTENLAPTF